MAKTYFECGIRYDKVLENGAIKKVTELYVIDALSFTEVEARIIKAMESYITGDFEVATIKRANINEICVDDLGVISATDAAVQKLTHANSKATGSVDKWYKGKLFFKTINDNGNVKRSPYNLLINAGSINAAHDCIVEYLKDTMIDYEISNIDETKILDVFIYDDENLKEKLNNKVTTQELLN